MKHLLLTFCLAWSIQATGATPRVPAKMRLANLKLQLTKGAQKRVQEKVDSLVRHERSFQTLLDRTNLFFPIIERVFKEEGIPLDFKYIAIQESGLVSDAAGDANMSIGFWQLKWYTAAEVGLKTKGKVDERMHIVASTRGAAKYLKKNNVHLDNWLYTLLAYNRGRGYVQKKLPYKKHRGAKRMRINNQTHWYVIHFLAHKLVFENKAGKERHPKLHLYEYQKAHGKTLSDIAKKFDVEKKQLKKHNKWLKRHRVPRDTTCAAIIPMTHQQYAKSKFTKKKRSTAKQQPNYAQYQQQATTFPVITPPKGKSKAYTKINGIVGTLAQPGDSLTSLAQAGHIALERFLVFNDIDKAHKVVPGQVYYYKAKRSKTKTRYHIVKPGETWWSIAQQYGIKKNKLLLKNRLRKEAKLKPGRVLWLRSIRPAKTPIAYVHNKDT